VDNVNESAQTSVKYGAITYYAPNKIYIDYSILWNNGKAGGLYDFRVWADASSSYRYITYSDIQQADITGTSVIHKAPYFTDTTIGNYNIS